MSYAIQNPTEFRENIRTKIKKTLTDLDILQKIADRHGIKPDTVVINLEKGVLNYTIRECSFKKLVKKW
jgi:uncharacterized glyoxalase superfamily metalloenzyme YdcJ